MNQKTNHIAIITPDLEYFSSSICTGIYKELSAHGYTMKVFITQEKPEKEIEYVKDLVFSENTKGLVIFSCLNQAGFYHEIIRQKYLPCVFVDRLIPYLPQCNFVTVDNYGGANQIGKKLIEKGAKNIVCLSMLPHIKITTIEDRINGFRDSHSNYKNLNCYRQDINYHDIIHSMKALLEKWEHENNFPDAIFAINHLIMNTFIALTEENKNWKKIRQNMILSCFDNLPYFDYIDIPIISVEQPIKEIAYYVSTILMKRIENKHTTDYSNIILPVRLIDRYK